MSSEKPPSYAVFYGNQIKSKICDSEKDALADALSRPQNRVQASWQHFVLKAGYKVREVTYIDMDAIYRKEKVNA